jgi:hypothetical protein
MLTDIEFDNGDMILGFRNRKADTGLNAFDRPYAGGADNLRVCDDNNDGWDNGDIEFNGSCGVLTSDSVAEGRTNGPGGAGKFYWDDDFLPGGSSHC